MTLLETLVALVVLGLTAIGFLELFQRVTVSATDTVAWTRAAQVAEWQMERAIGGNGVAAADTISGMRTAVTRRPWRDGLTDIEVQVYLPGPGTAHVELHRLVRQ